MKKLLFLLPLLVVLIFLPQLASSKIGKWFVERTLAQKIKGSAKVSHLHFSWLGPQKIEHIFLSSPTLTGSIDSLEAPLPFWRLSQFSRSFTLQNGTFPPYDLTHVKGKIEEPTLAISGQIGHSGHFSLKGQIDNHILTLQEPFLASFLLSPDLTRPLGIELTSQAPATLTISPEGFQFPLKRPSDIQIEHAVLDLGQLKASPPPPLYSLLALLKAPPSGPTLDLWLTPLSFTLQNHILTLGRLDALLAHTLHLCSWGSVDLVSQNLSLFLGIPAEALARSFGLQLPSQYVLKLPISGTLSQPKIQTAQASSQIAALIAAQQLPQTKKGKLLGGLMNMALQPKEDPTIPPPNRPFPWEE